MSPAAKGRRIARTALFLLGRVGIFAGEVGLLWWSLWREKLP